MMGVAREAQQVSREGRAASRDRLWAASDVDIYEFVRRMRTQQRRCDMLSESHAQVSVSVHASVIVARIRGVPTEDVLVRCQAQVVKLVKEQGIDLVLYDAMDMEAPSLDVAWSQRTIDAQISFLGKRAIVVPNARIAYLARLAFADEFGVSRVIYDDFAEAFAWLKKRD